MERPKVGLELNPSDIYINEILKTPLDNEAHLSYLFVEFKILIEDLIVNRCKPLSEDEINALGGRDRLNNNFNPHTVFKGRTSRLTWMKYFCINPEATEFNGFIEGDTYSYEQSFNISINEDKSIVGPLMGFQLRHISHWDIEDFLNHQQKLYTDPKEFPDFIYHVVNEFQQIIDGTKQIIVNRWLDSRSKLSTSKKRLTITESLMLFYVIIESFDSWPDNFSINSRQAVAELISVATDRNTQSILNQFSNFLEESQTNTKYRLRVQSLVKNLNIQELSDVADRVLK